MRQETSISPQIVVRQRDNYETLINSKPQIVDIYIPNLDLEKEEGLKCFMNRKCIKTDTYCA